MKVTGYMGLLLLLINTFGLILLTVIALCVYKIPWIKVWEWKWVIMTILGVIIFLLAIEFFKDLQNYTTEPLPSDQEMIEHFYAYKEEFEALVASAREYDEYWGFRPGVRGLREKVGIYTIIGSSGKTSDDPFARDSEPTPEPGFPDYPKDVKRRKEKTIKYNREILIIKMKNKEKYYKNYNNMGLNWKDYIYFHDGRVVKNNRIVCSRKRLGGATLSCEGILRQTQAGEILSWRGEILFT